MPKTLPISDVELQRLKVKVRALNSADVAYEKAVRVQRELRLEVGRVLMRVRPQWPASGPNAKGWGEFLDAVGLTQPRAWELMQLAGHVEEHGLNADDEIPSLRESGARPPDPVPEVEIDRDTWCTPHDLAIALGDWDLDPCSNERSHIAAAREFRLEQRGEDGLTLASKVDASARVFINPPYSDVLPWIEGYAHTRFCFLLKLDPSTAWFERLFGLAEVLLVPRGTRVQFEAPAGVPPEKSKANPFPHALFYARAADATPAIREMCFQPWRTK